MVAWPQLIAVVLLARLSPLSSSVFPTVTSRLGNLINDARENFNSLRYSSFRAHREDINKRLVATFETFMRRQSAASSDAKRELERLTAQLQKLYDETSDIKVRQEQDLAELTRQSLLQRPRGLDESLEAFRRAYNESLESLLPPRQQANDNLNKRPPRGMRLPVRAITTSTLQQTWQTLVIDEPFAKQMEAMRRELVQSWDVLLSRTSDVTSQAELAITSRVDNLHRLQGQLVSSARGVLNTTSASLARGISSRELSQERRLLEARLRELEREGKAWLDQQVTQLDASIHAVQDRIQQSNRAYDDLVSKRRASMYYTALNDAALNKILQLIDLSAPGHGWQLVRAEDGYVVYRKFLLGQGSQYACVMCSGTIHAPPRDVFALFEDNTRVPEYNSFYERGRDLEVVAENTKITWTATPPVFPFKPRDFCTLVHMRKLKDGTFVVLNKATTHPDAPHLPGYVRGQIVLAANIIQPVPGDARKSRLTMITQLDPGGFAPPVAINHVSLALSPASCAT